MQLRDVYLLVTLIVGFVGEPHIERIVAGLIANTQEVLSLTRTLVAGSVLVSAMLTTTAFVLDKKKIANQKKIQMCMNSACDYYYILLRVRIIADVAQRDPRKRS